MLLESDECVIHEKYGSKKFVVAIQMMKNQMFPMKIETCFSPQSVVEPPKQVCTIVQKQKYFKSVIKDPSKLWHLRYGHLGHAGLNLLSKKRKVDGFPHVGESNSKCEACILVKQHRMPFNSGNSTRVRAPLELVHTNLVGPM